MDTVDARKDLVEVIDAFAFELGVVDAGSEHATHVFAVPDESHGRAICSMVADDLTVAHEVRLASE